MTDSSRSQAGLRSAAVPAACRAVLREVLHGSAAKSEETLPAEARQHLAQCASCTERVRASEQLGSLVAAKPAMPNELSSRKLWERIHEEVVETAEAGPMGRLLDSSDVRLPESEQPKLEEVVSLRGKHLADSLMPTSEQPSEVEWSKVRQSILSDVAARRLPLRRLPVRLPLLLAGAAASVVIGFASLSDGTSEPPQIVFTELEHPPDVEFAVLRYGARR